MQFKLTLTLLSVVLLHACSPAITKNITLPGNPLPDTTPVTVLYLDEPVPENAREMGSVKLTDSGFTTKCRYDYVIEQATIEAIQMGGNILKITKHRKPDLWSSCHRIEARVFYSNQPPVYAHAKSDSAGIADEYSSLMAAESSTYSKEEVISPFDDYQKFRLSFNGGFGYRVNKIHKDLSTLDRQHVKKIKFGGVFNADATYFIRENRGIALKYSLHSASASSSNRAPSSTGYNTITMEDDVYIHYVGPNYVFRLFNSSGKGSFIASIGLGYMAYIDNSEISNRSPDRITLTGQTLGTNLDAGYEIYLTKQLSVGAQISYYSGLLTKIKAKSYYGISETIELDKDKYEGLNRIDISAGLRLNF